MRIWSVEQMATEQKIWITKKNRDMTIAVVGEKGTGKTTFCERYCKANALTETDFEVLRRRCIYPCPSEVLFRKAIQMQKAIERYSAFWSDEATDISKGQDWMHGPNKAFNRYLHKNRKIFRKTETETLRVGNNVFLMCIPFFLDMTRTLRRKFDRLVWCIGEGQALVFCKSKSPMSSGSFREDEMCKKYDSYMTEHPELKENELRAEHFLEMWGNLPNCLALVKFTKMPAEVEEYYEKVLSESPEENSDDEALGTMEKRTRSSLGTLSTKVADIAKEAADAHAELTDFFLKNGSLPGLEKVTELLQKTKSLTVLDKRAKLAGMTPGGLWKCEAFSKKDLKIAS